MPLQTTLAAEPITIYFFDPDTSQRNLGQMQREVSEFFTKQKLDVHFQAFARFPDFVGEMRNKPPAFAYVPAWYVQRYGAEQQLRPLLKAVQKGQTSYRKQLIVNAARRTLAGTTVATTNLGPETPKLLNKILYARRGVSLEDLSVVEVPRDADAVFAVALGQVESALVSEASLRQLFQINPRLVETVKVVDETTPIGLPVLCVVSSNTSEVAVQQIQELVNKNKELALALQVEGWRAAQ